MPGPASLLAQLFGRHADIQLLDLAAFSQKGINVCLHFVAGTLARSHIAGIRRIAFAASIKFRIIVFGRMLLRPWWFY